MNTPFILAEWELPPHSEINRVGVATEQGPLHMLGEKQNCLLRPVPMGWKHPVLFVRNVDDDDEASWVPVHRAWDRDRSLSWGMQEKDDRNWLSQIGFGEFGRIVCFEKGLAVLSPNGNARWEFYPEAGQTRELVHFHWHDGSRDWTNVPARRWKESLERDMAKPQSQARVAYNWAFMSEEQRLNAGWSCRGGLKALRNVMLWSLYVHPDLDMNKAYAWDISYSHIGNETQFDWQLYPQFSLPDGPSAFSVSIDEEKRLMDVDWQWSWGWVVRELFALQSKHRQKQRHYCMLHSQPASQFLVERPPISHHDRIEAALHLRKWAQARGVELLDGQLPPFDVEEWELAPASPENRRGVATVRARTRWLGEERDFWLRQIEMAPGWYVLFARPCIGSPEANFALCRERNGELGLSESNYRADVAPVWCARIQSSTLARFFLLDLSRWNEAGHAVFLLDANGRGHISWFAALELPSEHDNPRAVFRWNARGLVEAPSRDRLARLKTELDDSNSDVRFALRWLHLSDKERIAQILCCERGDCEELFLVLKWVLHCPRSLPRPRTQPHGAVKIWAWQPWPDEELHELFSHKKVRLSPHLKRWRAALWEWFAPSLRQELVEAHPCIRAFLERREKRLFEVHISPLEHIDEDEAAHHLRDWARGKVPDELLKTLR